MATDETLDPMLQVVARIGEAEMSQDVAEMDTLLHSDLVFRRSDGSVARKPDVLAAMRERNYAVREAVVTAVDKPSGAVTAVVTFAVRAKGSFRSKGADAAVEFDGTWRNVMTLELEDGRNWRCRLWINTRIGITVETLHHVSLPVTDLERSKRFYRDILGLRERHRPPFDFDGAWYQLGAGQLHLIVHKDRPSPPTFREHKPVDSRDVHFAVRARSFRETLGFLKSQGYDETAENEVLRLRVSPEATAGFPQIYLLDPDRHVIELNFERLDDTQS